MYEIAIDTRGKKELEQDNRKLISSTPSLPWYEQQQKNESIDAIRARQA